MSISTCGKGHLSIEAGENLPGTLWTRIKDIAEADSKTLFAVRYYEQQHDRDPPRPHFSMTITLSHPKATDPFPHLTSVQGAGGWLAGALTAAAVKGSHDKSKFRQVTEDRLERLYPELQSPKIRIERTHSLVHREVPGETHEIVRGTVITATILGHTAKAIFDKNEGRTARDIFEPVLLSVARAAGAVFEPEKAILSLKQVAYHHHHIGFDSHFRDMAFVQEDSTGAPSGAYFYEVSLRVRLPSGLYTVERERWKQQAMARSCEEDETGLGHSAKP